MYGSFVPRKIFRIGNIYSNTAIAAGYPSRGYTAKLQVQILERLRRSYRSICLSVYLRQAVSTERCFENCYRRPHPTLICLIRDGSYGTRCRCKE